jgi:hypothetical protein
MYLLRKRQATTFSRGNPDLCFLFPVWKNGENHIHIIIIIVFSQLYSGHMPF